MLYKNYQQYNPKFNWYNYVSSHETLIQDITLDNIEIRPRLIVYDDKSCEWIIKEAK